MHSPFGAISHARKELAYTRFEIMWVVSWAMAKLELNDKPRYKRKGDEVNPITGERGVIKVDSKNLKKHRQQLRNG